MGGSYAKPFTIDSTIIFCQWFLSFVKKVLTITKLNYSKNKKNMTVQVNIVKCFSKVSAKTTYVTMCDK